MGDKEWERRANDRYRIFQQSEWKDYLNIFYFGIGYFVYKVQFFPYQHRYISSSSLMFTQMVHGSHIKSYIGAMH